MSVRRSSLTLRTPSANIRPFARHRSSSEANRRARNSHPRRNYPCLSRCETDDDPKYDARRTTRRQCLDAFRRIVERSRVEFKNTREPWVTSGLMSVRTLLVSHPRAMLAVPKVSLTVLARETNRSIARGQTRNAAASIPSIPMRRARLVVAVAIGIACGIACLAGDEDARDSSTRLRCVVDGRAKPSRTSKSVSGRAQHSRGTGLGVPTPHGDPSDAIRVDACVARWTIVRRHLVPRVGVSGEPQRRGGRC